MWRNNIQEMARKKEKPMGELGRLIADRNNFRKWIEAPEAV